MLSRVVSPPRSRSSAARPPSQPKVRCDTCENLRARCAFLEARVRELEEQLDASKLQLEQRALLASASANAPGGMPMSLNSPEIMVVDSPRFDLSEAHAPAPQGLATASATIARSDTATEEAELMSSLGDMLFECSVADAPQKTEDIDGQCTVVRVTAADRPRLLADLTAVLAGVGLYIGKMSTQTTWSSSNSDMEDDADVDGQATFEFWVQETSGDGLGPVLERVKRRGIEQRLRQWSMAAPVLERQAQPKLQTIEGGTGAAEAGGATPEGHDHPKWPGAKSLPAHATDDDDAPDSTPTPTPTRASLISALTAALSTPELTWLGALPPALARRTATALLPHMTRLELPAGLHVERSSDDWLLLLESEMTVACTTAIAEPREKAKRESMPRISSWQAVGHAVGPWWHVIHPAAAVLCLSSSLGIQSTSTAIATGNGNAAASLLNAVQTTDGAHGLGGKAALPARLSAGVGALLSSLPLPVSRDQSAVDGDGGGTPRLAWQAIRAPAMGAVVSVVSRATLRALLAETRRATERMHAQQLAGASVFSPLSTAQLLALCRRAVEMEVPPRNEILRADQQTGQASPLPPRRQTSQHVLSPRSPARRLPASGAAGSREKVINPGGVLPTGGMHQKNFFVLLRGTIIVQYHLEQPPQGLPPTLPLARLQPMAPVGAVGALCGTSLLTAYGVSAADLSYVAGDDGATILSWSSDEFLQRELSKLPDLLATSFFCKTPFAFCLWIPELLPLIRPTTLTELCARVTPANQLGAAQRPKPELCCVLRGTLESSVDELIVSIELVSERASSNASTDESAMQTPVSSPNRPRRVSRDSASFATTHRPPHPTRVGTDNSKDRRHSADSLVSNSPSTGRLDRSSQVLHVRIELPARGKKLAQISTLLDELGLDVSSANVTSKNDVAQESFTCRYAGECTPKELETRLAQRLRNSLHGRYRLMPGDTFLATGVHALRKSAWAASGTGDATFGGGGGDDDDDVLLGVLNLHELGIALADPKRPSVSELWLRYLQAHSPPLLMSLASPKYQLRMPVLAKRADGSSDEQSAHEQTSSWLEACVAFMLLYMRRHVGGVSLSDGVHMRDLLIGPMVGEGAYGTVYLARHRVLDNRWYAVKRLSMTRLRGSPKGRQELRYLERERELLSLLARETRGTPVRELFVRLITSNSDGESLQLVMPAVLGGELFLLLEEFGAMEEAAVVFYAACITIALQHLHSRGIAYRDLKSENVLLTGGFSSPAAGWPVLADFGLANFAKNDNLTTFCGTAAFIAPEVAASTAYGTAADWWSLGILICQCLTLTTPFEGANPKATIDNVLHGRRVRGPALDQLLDLDDNADADGEISINAAKIIDALLQPDPAERLGGALRGSEVRVQPFFWGFDWTTIEKRTMTPPHAKICRERAIASIGHPALRLPPLPTVPQARYSKEEAPAAGGERGAAPLAAASTAAAPTPRAAPLSALPAHLSSSFSQQSQPSFGLADDEDLADFV